MAGETTSPTGVIAPESHSGDLALECAAVVVGTGAGGAMMARRLAEAGVDVIALEMGKAHKPSDFNQREDEMFEALFQQRGAQATDDQLIRILSGIGVGGSTVHNTNLCRRTPDPLLERWASEHGVSGADPTTMAPQFAATEAELDVTLMGPSAMNRNNALFKQGVEALGWRGGFLHHNRKGCLRSGFCELGCAYDAKQNAAKVLIPGAIAAGARVYAGARVERVLVEQGRTVGVAGAIVDPDSGARRHGFTVKAKVVCLAGSAVRSPALLQASGITDPAGLTGRNFRCHPGAIVAAVFKDPVESWRGIPQSYECTELLGFEDDSKRIWMVPGAAHPIGSAVMTPGFGPDHMRMMRLYPRTAAVIVMVDELASGAVTARPDGSISIRHALGAEDKAQLSKGLEAAARILLAAGAEEVLLPWTDPLRIRDESGLAAIQAHGVPDYDLALTGVHPMGTLRMGDDPRRAVVSSRGEHHGLPGLFVCDGSIFPTALGVPPQISIYTFSRHISRFVLEALS